MSWLSLNQKEARFSSWKNTEVVKSSTEILDRTIRGNEKPSDAMRSIARVASDGLLKLKPAQRVSSARGS
jgi:hypothetical protein